MNQPPPLTQAQSYECWKQAYRERWQQWPRWKRLLFWWNNPRVLEPPT